MGEEPLHGRRADRQDAGPDRRGQYRLHRRRPRARSEDEGARLRPVPDRRSRRDDRSEEGRPRHAAWRRGLHHAAHAADRPDARHIGRGGAGENEERRAHHQLRARRADRRGGAEGGARQGPCRRRGARRVRRGTGQGQPAVRHARPGRDAASRRVDDRGAGQRRHSGRRTDVGFPADGRRHQRAQRAVGQRRGGAAPQTLYGARRQDRRARGPAADGGACAASPSRRRAR